MEVKNMFKELIERTVREFAIPLHRNLYTYDRLRLYDLIERIDECHFFLSKVCIAYYCNTVSMNDWDALKNDFSPHKSYKAYVQTMEEIEDESSYQRTTSADNKY